MFANVGGIIMHMRCAIGYKQALHRSLVGSRRPYDRNKVRTKCRVIITTTIDELLHRVYFQRIALAYATCWGGRGHIGCRMLAMATLSMSHRAPQT